MLRNEKFSRDELLFNTIIIAIVVVVCPIIFQSCSADTSPGIGTVTAGPDIIPRSVPEIEHEILETISETDTRITTLVKNCTENQSNSRIIRDLDKILADMNSHLYKYETLSGLYPDPDLRNAAEKGIIARNTILRSLAGNSTLYQCIQSAQPVSEQEKWLYEQELLFFSITHADVLQRGNEKLISLQNELDSLHLRYITNIRDNRPVSENLQILNQSASVRSDIATIFGYENWVDLVAFRQGWEMNGSHISDRLEIISQLAEEAIKPIITHVLENKKIHDPDTTSVYDYEIIQYMNELSRQQLPEQTQIFSIPTETIVSRSVCSLSCLMNFTTRRADDYYRYAQGVELFRVSDKSNTTRAWFYLDLYNRPGKNQEWMTTLIHTGWNESDGDIWQQSAPTFIVSGNIRENRGITQFGEEELTLLFHELGHLYTRILTWPGTGEDTPLNIPIEFTEAFSRFFEFLPWTAEFQALLSAPMERTQVVTGLFTNGQNLTSKSPHSLQNRWLFAYDTIIALLDSKIAQSSGDVRFGEWYTEIYTDITGATVTNQGGSLLQHPHLSGSTAGALWIYPVGDLYASIMYDMFFKTGFFDQTTWNDITNNLLIGKNRSWNYLEHNDSPGWKEPVHPSDNSIPPDETFPANNWQYVPGCLMECQ